MRNPTMGALQECGEGKRLRIRTVEGKRGKGRKNRPWNNRARREQGER
jgi:hypothetical protein